ncbi:winged helix-turn-helix domain-containing protein [Haloferax larsenii]|uniref:Winged helix-turn-helix domain-containing protein n=1 Tax=Haloferax larsenii TaxID=302484 RepID=A0ABY5RED5_HALLR|nr:winged helix-turn-helix domain-containing protein [Haloferax larsenii]UVE50707.1 winged helix-turn-helix domain-containing protein [Haloferax larsenii]
MSNDSSSAVESNAESAFSLLADETRLAIVRALANATDTPLTFSELRERVGTIDSGRFNYHLGKLTGRFVEKTDDGYELRLAGQLVFGAILAGSYSRGDDVGPIPLDPPCPMCGGDIEATYADERITVQCTECDKPLVDVGIPPGVFEGYDIEELPAVADRYTRTLFSQARAGFCITCRGTFEGRLVRSGDDSRNDVIFDDVHAAYSCDRCNDELVTGVGMVYLDHPAVVSFYYDHDIDLSQPHLWGTAWRTMPDIETVSDDPLRAEVTFEVDDDTLTLRIDEDLNVLDVARSPAE